MMEERRLNKGTNNAAYEELNREIKLACDAAKENWLREQCEEIERMERSHQLERMHKKIKEVTGKRRSARSNIIKKNKKNRETL